MKPLLSPKHKLVVAGLALVAVLVLGAQAASAASVARLLLGGAAVVGLAWWLRRSDRGGRFKLPPRVEVVQRVGLNQRTALALVEVDGRTLLVVHGEGFARVQRLPSARRSAPRPRLVSPARADESIGGLS